MKNSKPTNPPQPLHNTIGIVYDFDETLSPDNMQEDTIFRSYGINKKEFWEKANKLVTEKGYERTLAYLKLLIHDETFRNKPLTRRKLQESAKHIRFFPGVLKYFDVLDHFMSTIPEVKKLGIQVEHYIISSGITEILEGTEIYPHFKRVYACSYEYDESDHPIFPKLVINDTNKTQFLFRINKGALDLSQDINSHMPDQERRIPFENMIYIGDSSTDIPSMTVVKKYGGHTIAVYDEEHAKQDTMNPKTISMVKHNRASHFAPANYSEGTLLIKILKQSLKKIIHTIVYDHSAKISYKWVEDYLDSQ